MKERTNEAHQPGPPSFSEFASPQTGSKYANTIRIVLYSTASNARYPFRETIWQRPAGSLSHAAYVFFLMSIASLHFSNTERLLAALRNG